MTKHTDQDHIIEGSPYGRARAVLARHLCGWISGHSAPLDHFNIDAENILEEMHIQGIRFHLVEKSSNSLDGFIDYGQIQ
jgi:hypothetical protein